MMAGRDYTIEGAVATAINEANTRGGGMGCKHDWALQSDTVLSSPAEQMGLITSFKGGGVWLFQKKHIVILTCEICGKIHKTTTSLFEGM